MDSSETKFRIFNLTLNSTQQALAFTLQQGYLNHKSPDVGYIFYNDEKPLSAGGQWSSTSGHTKGTCIVRNVSISFNFQLLIIAMKYL